MRKAWRSMVVLLLLLFLAGCGSSVSDDAYEKGMEMLQDNDYEKAISYFNKAIDGGERLAEAYRGLGISQLKAGDNAAAIAAFSRSLNEMEGSNKEFAADVMIYLAQARKSYGEYEEAAEVYTDLLKIEKNPEYYYQRGSIYLALEQYEEAKTDFDAAVKDSRDYDMYVNIYDIYQSEEMQQEGEAYLEQALAIEPKSAEDYVERGRICYELKDYDQAKEELNTTIADGNTDAMLMLGKVYLDLNDSASARSMYKDYQEQDENPAKAYNGLAMCDIADKNYENALANIEQGLACEDAKEEQSLRFNEIVCYEYLLDFETAKEKMASYLETYPHDEQAQRENLFLSTR